ncbi:MAG: STAS/SEC14 domain-containing protein [Geminicoccaceae bacterium]|mgnify:CR=1 FL=1|nr:STAS/SEC14 domain-containing protein [Geminicoccaceae bacterium]
MSKGSRIVPTLRYRDTKEAVDWLCRAFGFERHKIAEKDDGSIEHAELGYGDALVMLGDIKDGGSVPQEDVKGTARSIYVVVDDVEKHHERAMAAGATIARAPEDTSYGSREYSVRDPEGYIWHFGSYDPWAKAPGRIDYEEDDATGVVEIRVAGRVTSSGFEPVKKKLEAFLARHEKVRLIEVIESFEGMELSMLFEDLFFSLRHMRRFSHVAVVTDLRWVERMANASAVVLPARLRVFPQDALEEARGWVRRAA